MHKAILFDMDGLMVDSKLTWIAAEKRFIEEYGKEYSQAVTKKYHGLRVSGMIAVMIKEYHLPVTQEEGERKLKAYAQRNFEKADVKLLPGCLKLVEALSSSGKYNMAIASSSPQAIIQTFVKRFGFQNYFNGFVSGEEVPNGKPAPDVFLKAAELLMVDPEYCLVLEDAPNGIKAAKAAGMKAIAVNSSPHYILENFKEADRFVKSLEEINLQVIEDVFI